MGWWNITDDRAGLSFLSGEPDEKTEMYCGDGPADIMGPAVTELIELYEESWKRKPYVREVMAAVEFVTGSHELEETATPGYTEKKEKALWEMAEKAILEHAGSRVRKHTDAGGHDLEIIDDTCKEVFELCRKVATGEIPVNELQEKLEESDDGNA